MLHAWYIHGKASQFHTYYMKHAYTLKGLCSFEAVYHYYAIMRNIHTQYTCKYEVVFRVKPVNKADTNAINRPLIDSTSNVTIDSGKQSTIRSDVLM